MPITIQKVCQPMRVLHEPPAERAEAPVADPIAHIQIFHAVAARRAQVRPQGFKRYPLLLGFMPAVINNHIERPAVRGDLGQEFPVGLVADEHADVRLLMLAARRININARYLCVRVLPPPILEAAPVTHPNLQQGLDTQAAKFLAIGRQIMRKLLKMLHSLTQRFKPLPARDGKPLLWPALMVAIGQSGGAAETCAESGSWSGQKHNYCCSHQARLMTPASHYG